MTINKPTKIMVPMPAALNWRGVDCCLQRKFDGAFEVRTIGFGAGHVAEVAGELMKRKAGGIFTAEDRTRNARFASWYAAFDLLSLDGADMRGEPLRLRWRELARILPCFGASGDVVFADSGFGGDFVAALVAAGAEGACAKPWEQPWGSSMWVCKPLQTFYCVVTGFKGGTQSVTIALTHGENFARGESCGGLKLGGGKCDQVRIGSIVKVEAVGVAPSGMLREVRICNDTADSWLCRF